ncbi:MAG: methyl-accepting chemotaxis protein [Butyrivibrio sp.]|uniref:methyl-accepting chemotaxis protein n=1 Tax=Butyrivibrio sp. LB2008 TaxID=1408305 RepID=UPI000479E75F|nr:methyl-accepting chemotaxis protein [Butyrivibrio sp. LB2008]MEE3494841.1 methyl-accepting chemotaxis protein [Butyrivibrio sp.]
MVKLNSLRFKLTAFFLIPVIFIMIVGYTAYSIASKGTRDTYESNAVTALEQIANYYELTFAVVESKTEQLSSLSELKNYYGGAYTDVDESRSALSDIYRSAKNLAQSDNIVGDLSILSYKQTSFSVANGNYLMFEYGGSSAAGEFENTNDFALLNSSGTEGAWMGTRVFIDSYEAANSIESTPYCAVYVKPFYNSLGEKLGYISTDIKLDTSLKALESIHLGEGSTFAFITSDGVETNMDGRSGANETIFANTTFFEDVRAASESSGFEWMKDAEDKKIYLYVYAKVGESGAVICGRIPESTISAGVNSIRLASVIAVILATVVSSVVGIVVSNSIGNAVKGISNGFEQAAHGDLTVEISSKRKDEFGALASSANKMIENTKRLLLKISATADSLKKSSVDIGGASDSLVTASENITTSVDEIRQGLDQQAHDAGDCLAEADSLTEKIEVVRENVKAIDDMAADADESVKNGIEAVENLKTKANETSEVTKGVIVDIEQLASETSSIGNIIATINDIASQTNLLSLNASIEAARAGEAGRGFSVVAEQIRKLAEQSAVSAGEIGDIITAVTAKTEKTATEAKHAEEIVIQQEEAVATTLAEFNVINENVKTIADHLKEIGLQVAEMEKAKVNTLSAVDGISAVSEEAAASSAEVGATALAAQNAAKDLNDVIKDLSGAADSLTTELTGFKL